MIYKCPGQDDRNINSETISCPDCGYRIEIFSDEVKVKCPKCRSLVCRERLPSCVDWCKYAADCIGKEAYSRHLDSKKIFLRDKLLKELVEYFGSDTKRINHAKKVLGFAEELLKEEQADWNIVIPASILHDVGIKAAEEKYGVCPGHLQEKEGPEIAGQIMLKAGLKKEDIEEICRIIANHHTPGVVNTRNFYVLYDADWLVNFQDEIKTDDRGKLKGVIEKIFLTKAGREMAERLYLA